MIHWNIDPWGNSQLPYFKIGYVQCKKTDMSMWKTMQGRLYLGWIHIEL